MKNILPSLILFFALPVFAQQGVVTNNTNKIEWLDWDEMMTRMETKPKKIFVFITADWVGWGKKMNSETLSDPAIIKTIQKYFYAVQLDAEYKNDILIKGRTYRFVPNGRRGYHELAAELLNGRMAYPDCVFIDERLGLIQAIPGFKQARELEPMLVFFGSDSYKAENWEIFLRNYKFEKED